MKANWIAGGLLLVLYLLWLTATAPARLLAPMLPPGVQVGQFSGSVWRGAAQPVYWHGERLERLAWSLTLAGWQVSLSDPRGVMVRPGCGAFAICAYRRGGSPPPPACSAAG